MPLEATGRKHVSELIAQTANLNGDNGVYFYATVDVKGSGSLSPIGGVLEYDGTDAFRPLAVAADWAATTAYVVGDVVKPTTRDGYEYVCVTAGTSGGSEPTWVNTVEGSETTDNTVTWASRTAYSSEGSSLPTDSILCVTCGTSEGLGNNSADITLSETATKVTVIFRGDAILINEGLEWGAIAAADQAEIKKQLEKQSLAIVDEAQVVVPSYVA